MPALSTWNLDPTRILTRRELATVLADLAGRADRFVNVHRNLIIVRLAGCCGLCVSEIAGLQLDDLVVEATPAPAIAATDHQGEEGAVRAALVGTRRHWPTPVWKARRVEDGARSIDPFIVAVHFCTKCRKVNPRRAERFCRARRRVLSHRGSLARLARPTLKSRPAILGELHRSRGPVGKQIQCRAWRHPNEFQQSRHEQQEEHRDAMPDSRR